MKKSHRDQSVRGQKFVGALVGGGPAHRSQPRRGVGGFAALLFLAAIINPQSAISDLAIANGIASNITRLSADFPCTITATNGSGTNPVLTVFYGTTDFTTNAGSWSYSNVYGQAGVGTISTNIAGLTPAQLYYFRWRAVETTNTAWASGTSNFWTLAGAPTNQPTNPPSGIVPLQVYLSGLIAAPSNFISTNNIATTGSVNTVSTNLAAHTADTNNPHAVTPGQIGAAGTGDVNTVSTNLAAHTADTNNPHAVTPGQIGAAGTGDVNTVSTNLAAHTADTNNPHTVTAAQAGSVATNDPDYQNLITNTATLAQGAKADAALPKAGGVMTGKVTNEAGFYGDGSGLTNLPGADISTWSTIPALQQIIQAPVTTNYVYGTNQLTVTGEGLNPSVYGIYTNALTTVYDADQNTNYPAYGSTNTYKAYYSIVYSGYVIPDGVPADPFFYILGACPTGTWSKGSSPAGVTGTPVVVYSGPITGTNYVTNTWTYGVTIGQDWYGATTGQDWSVVRNGTNQILIKNGNIGIGTNTPAAKLDVLGNIKVSGSVTGASYYGGGIVTNPLAAPLNCNGKAVTNADYVQTTGVTYSAIVVTSQTTNNNTLTISTVGFYPKGAVVFGQMEGQDTTSQGVIDSSGGDYCICALNGANTFISSASFLQDPGLKYARLDWTGWTSNGATFTRTPEAGVATHNVTYIFLFYR